MDVKVSEARWIDPEYRGLVGRIVGTVGKWMMVRLDGFGEVGFERHELSVI